MPLIAFQLLVQDILILINAFFAATEIVVVSLNANKLRKLEEEGDKLASKLLRMVEEPAGFLSTIQIGITLAGFLGSAFAADNLAGRLSQWFAAQYALTAAAEAAGRLTPADQKFLKLLEPAPTGAAEGVS